LLEGIEISLHAICDGETAKLFPTSQDHKRALDGDQGLNTGGMGTFSPPAKLLTPAMEERVRREVLDPFIAGLQRDGLDFRGMLFRDKWAARTGAYLVRIIKARSGTGCR